MPLTLRTQYIFRRITRLFTGGIPSEIICVFRAERYKWSLGLTAINQTNKVALYNFLDRYTGEGPSTGQAACWVDFLLPMKSVHRRR